MQGLFCFALFLMAFPHIANAQELEPRSYANIPQGMNFAVGAYAFGQGAVLVDPSSVIEDANVSTHAFTLAYARSLSLFGKSAKIDIIAPYAWAEGEAFLAGEFRAREVSGFADPRVRLAVNLYGAPSLSMKDFAGYRQDLVVGASLQISLPVGQYDFDRLLNIGTNRWYFKPEIGLSKTIGRLTLEAAGAMTIYSDNKKFFGGQVRKQKSLYSLQAHVLYDFGAGIWAALNSTLYAGGRTNTNDIRMNDMQENARLGLTLSIPLNQRNSIKLFGSTGVYNRTGSDFDVVGIAWQHRWTSGQ